MCLGYRPTCRAHPFFEGAYYSYLCHDEAPFVTAAELTRNATDPGSEEAFVDNPYLTLCKAWSVGASDPALHQPVMSTIPLLLYTGQFDAFGPAPVADDALSSLTGAYVVHAPYEGHNVLGTLDCFRDIRNAWIENPTAPPDTGCVDDTPPPSFKLP